MIKTVEIKKVEDASALILDTAYDKPIDRLRTDYLFRGIADTSYKLETSLLRNCGSRQLRLEMPILRNFTKYASIDDPSLNESVWKQLIVGQHHGLPTRLLDWTHSSLVAMHFATSENNIENTAIRDGIVWRINAEELVDLLPGQYKAKLKAESAFAFSIESLSSIVKSPQDYDRDMDGKAMIIIEPPSLDQRIINQYSYFSVTPMGMDIEDFLDKNTNDTVKYIIDKDVRWDIRDVLDQFNISERIIYPGLDGLSKWIGRHYYVKDSLR